MKAFVSRLGAMRHVFGRTPPDSEESNGSLQAWAPWFSRPQLKNGRSFLLRPFFLFVVCGYLPKRSFLFISVARFVVMASTPISKRRLASASLSTVQTKNSRFACLKACT